MTPSERAERIKAIVDTFPPLTAEQRGCLALLLHGKPAKPGGDKARLADDRGDGGGPNRSRHRHEGQVG